LVESLTVDEMPPVAQTAGATNEEFLAQHGMTREQWVDLIQRGQEHYEKHGVPHQGMPPQQHLPGTQAQPAQPSRSQQIDTLKTLAGWVVEVLGYAALGIISLIIALNVAVYLLTFIS